MVKSSLVFFDGMHQSRLGTARGLVAIVPILIILSASFLSSEPHTSIWPKACGIALVALMLCSAIGVQLPTSYSVAIIYGLLVGFVVGVCYLGLKLMTGGGLLREDFYLMFLILLSCAVAAAVTRAFSLRFSLYPSEQF